MDIYESGDIQRLQKAAETNFGSLMRVTSAITQLKTRTKPIPAQFSSTSFLLDLMLNHL
jgi:hypothetical protein